MYLCDVQACNEEVKLHVCTCMCSWWHIYKCVTEKSEAGGAVHKELFYLRHSQVMFSLMIAFSMKSTKVQTLAYYTRTRIRIHRARVRVQ